MHSAHFLLLLCRGSALVNAHHHRPVKFVGYGSVGADCISWKCRATYAMENTVSNAKRSRKWFKVGNLETWTSHWVRRMEAEKFRGLLWWFYPFRLRETRGICALNERLIMILSTGRSFCINRRQSFLRFYSPLSAREFLLSTSKACCNIVCECLFRNDLGRLLSRLSTGMDDDKIDR